MKAMTLSEFAKKLDEMMILIMQKMTAQLTDEFYKLKVTMPQVMVMGFLTRKGESNMTDLANSLNVTTAAVTGVIDRLSRDGYVKRVNDPEDRRIVKVKLTKKGADLINTIRKHRTKMTMSLFSKVSQSDRQEYLRILEGVRAHLE